MKYLSRLTLLAMALLFAASVSAQTITFVRYSQNGGPISWGMVHDDGSIHQISDAPYKEYTHTGVVVQRDNVRLEAMFADQHEKCQQQ